MEFFIATAYNSVRALPGFGMSYGDFFRHVDLCESSVYCKAHLEARQVFPPALS